MAVLSFLQGLPSVSFVSTWLDHSRETHLEELLRERASDIALIQNYLKEHLEDPGATDHSAMDLHVAQLLRLLRAQRPAGPLGQAAMTFDALVQSTQPELLDTQLLPTSIKDFTMRLLHRTNVVAGSYDAWTREIEGLLSDVDRAHVYDLAAGTGGYARHLVRHLPRGKQLRVSSSDRAESYLAVGRQQAQQEGAHDVHWELCDALQLAPLRARGDVDLFLCTQAAHHFSPGQLVRMISQAVHSAKRGILIVDLFRSAINAIGTLLVAGVVAPFPVLLYDGFQSVRRAYTPAEFRLLATLAGARSIRSQALGIGWLSMHASM